MSHGIGQAAISLRDARLLKELASAVWATAQEGCLVSLFSAGFPAGSSNTTSSFHIVSGFGRGGRYLPSAGDPVARWWSTDTPTDGPIKAAINLSTT